MEPLITTKQLTIGSTVFGNKEFVPSKYTCERENVNPPLTIEGIPSSTKSLALVIEDPDAANGVFVHWAVWNIPPQEMIEENSIPGIQGKNSFGKTKYQGPCPPEGKTHRYHFKVYALDSLLELQAGSDVKMLDEVVSDYAIAYGEITGLYKKLIKNI
jgi:Raf kinase inhibitor-like YbhB/YbcL family protein